MRRELENWYGTKESWIKWCHFNVRLPCDCKKLFVKLPCNSISSSSQLYMTTWWLPDRTWPSSFWSALGTSSSPQLHPVSGTKISPSPRKSHSKLELETLFAYVCLGPFERMPNHIIIFLTFRFRLSAGWIVSTMRFGIRMVEFPTATSKLYPRILNNVIFRRSPDLSRIHDPAHGTFCRFLVGFSTSKHMCSCMAWNWSTNMSIKWLRSWWIRFKSLRVYCKPS